MPQPAEVIIGRRSLPGLLMLSESPIGLVIFAHGSGSSRFSARNRQAADHLNHLGFATLLFDLLTEAEANDRRNVFDISLLGARVVEAIDWARADARTSALSIGLFGASTGAGAAIVAAAVRPDDVSAVVSRGGRPDLAGEALGAFRAPNLLIVGEADREVLELNKSALSRMKGKASLTIVPRAGHLFEEAGTLEDALAAAGDWYERYLRAGRVFFRDRAAAGRALAAKIAKGKPLQPVIYALLRGGVPVAVEIAKTLNAPLDLLFARKIGVPWNEELAAGAVVDGEQPDIVLNEDIMRAVGLTRADIEAGAKTQLREIERRRALYMPGKRPVLARGRTAILVDDGIATGATMRAAIAAVRRRGPQRIIAAAPVASSSAVSALQEIADEVICLAAPHDFGGVGEFYQDFHQLRDEEIIDMLTRLVPAPDGPKGAESGQARQ
jgi:predicted phosphoribosyltransferase/pimeloyl-ACP methyl ester carboxylesterase